ncbi:MAG TPA: cytochrome c oxidase subunit II, partial [Chitinophagaceae bacterium]|nr:cytochrome c oxidase subunit II [Chitinophagaceae bacterium]
SKQMKEETGNPNFVYEISCDQMCGKGHWSMRGEIVVETQEEFDQWMATKKPKYFAAFPEKDPAAQKAAAADTTKVAGPVAMK